MIMRRFVVQRDEDMIGVSGTGVATRDFFRRCVVSLVLSIVAVASLSACVDSKSVTGVVTNKHHKEAYTTEEVVCTSKKMPYDGTYGYPVCYSYGFEEHHHSAVWLVEVKDSTDGQYYDVATDEGTYSRVQLGDTWPLQ